MNGKYKRFECTVGHVDGTDMTNATLNIYLDGTIAYTKDLKWDDLVTKVSIPLNNALQMKIEIIPDHYWVSYGISEGKFE